MFQKKVIEKYLSKLDSDLLLKKYIQYCSIFANKQKQENIRNSKEEQYQEGFIRDLFCSVLGYTIKPEANYNILTELKNESKSNSKKSDAAIIINNEVKAVIELKGTDTQDLDKVAFQAFSYKNHHEKCNYVIVSNFERLRLYVETQIEFTEFNLFKLTKEDFDLLYLLLWLDNISSDVPLKLKHETLTEEIEITNSFYADYSTFKRVLFEDLIENNPDIDKLLLFKKTQKLLDRLLFVMFCEDRNLLPTNSTLGIINDYKKLEELGYYQPLYNFFKTFFERIDKGFTHKTDHTRDVFAYNGGLFKSDETLDNIKVGDKVLLEHCPKLANYDFASQISVDILGRIFENSLTEIEEVQNEIENEKNGIKQKSSNIGKRKKDGVFYTPEYITKYIVENTIGKLCEEKKNELKINDTEFTFDKKYQKKKINELDERLNKYREWLLSLKILDCACGSGAFLNAALRELKKEHTLIDYFWSKIHKGELNFTQIDNTILENNLYGVDINDDSIEITKLSLWLHTATKNRKLTTLNDKIKCGNSLIDDASVAGEKAFDWAKEFPEVFCSCHNRHCLSCKGEPSIDGVAIQNSQLSTLNSQINDGVIGMGCDGCDCPKASGEDALKLSLEGENKREGDRIRSKASSVEQPSSQADSKNTPLISHLSSLTSQLKGGFDVIIGNPPYVNMKRIKNELERKFYQTHYKTAKNMCDLYSIFTEKSSYLLKENGLLGFIFSNSWLGLQAFFPFREFLLKDVEVSKLVELPEKVFADATVKTCICFYTNKKPSENAEIEIYHCDNMQNFISKGFSIPYQQLLNNTDYNFILDKIVSLEKIKTIQLKEIISYSSGIKTANDDKYILTKKENDDCYPFLRGRNIKKYSFSETTEFIWYRPDLMLENKNARPRIKENFTVDKKIVIQKIATEVSATLDKNKLLCGVTTNIIYETKNNYSMEFVLTLLNSKLINYWVKKTFPTGLDITINRIEQIPVPALITLDQQKPFIDLAEKMLALNADLQKKITRFIGRIKETYGFEKTSQNMENFYKLSFADFVKELSKVKVKLSMKQKDDLEDYFNDYVKDITALNETIATTDQQINNLVYKLYNLTEEEIKIIERE